MATTLVICKESFTEELVAGRPITHFKGDILDPADKDAAEFLKVFGAFYEPVKTAPVAAPAAQEK